MANDNKSEIVSRIHHGHNIRRLREAYGMSQNELSKKAFLSQQSVSRYESSPLIDNEILNKFAKALEVPVEVIKGMLDESIIQFGFENQDCTIGNIVNGTTVNIQSPMIENITELVKLITALQLENDKLKEEIRQLKMK